MLIKWQRMGNIDLHVEFVLLLKLLVGLVHLVDGCLQLHLKPSSHSRECQRQPGSKFLVMVRLWLADSLWYEHSSANHGYFQQELWFSVDKTSPLLRCSQFPWWHSQTWRWLRTAGPSRPWSTSTSSWLRPSSALKYYPMNKKKCKWIDQFMFLNFNSLFVKEFE